MAEAKKMKNETNIVEDVEELLAMFQFQNNKMKKNTNLSDKETKQIYGLFVELKKEGKKKEYYESVYDKCRDEINNLLKDKNYQPVNPSKNKGKVANGITRLPQLIKLLIYYMAYRAFELYNTVPEDARNNYKEPTQQEVLDYIGKVHVDSAGKKIKYSCKNKKGYEYKYDGYKLSDKMFTYFGVSPSVYCGMNNYRQIELPSSYAGAKVHYLGYCINWLSACAGTYDVFLDLFGGSASASMAVNQLDTSDYYINEYDFFNINYYHVMADDKLFKQYIAELNNVVERIKGQNYDANVGKGFYKTCEKKKNDWYIDYPLDNIKQYQNGNVTQCNYENYAVESDERKVDVAIAYTFIHSFSGTGGKNSAGAVSETKLKKFCKLSDDEYELFHKKMGRLKEIYNCDALDDKEFIIEYLTDKAPTRYQGVETISKEVRDGKKTYKECSDEEKKLLRLLGGSDKRLPRPFHTLTYVDSPYLETVGYRAGGIDGDQMGTLIGRLVTASTQGSHFIFSCRAGKSIEPSKYTNIAEAICRIERFARKDGQIELDFQTIYEDTQYTADNVWGTQKKAKAKSGMEAVLKLLKGNQSIYENVFKEFEKNKKGGKLTECYVLVCLNEKSIEDSLLMSMEELLNELRKESLEESLEESLKEPLEELLNELRKESLDKSLEKSLRGSAEKLIKKALNKLEERQLEKIFKRINERKIKELFTKLYVSEVFITDFDFIVPNRYRYTTAKKITSKTKSKQDYTFAKYEISDFCDLLDRYMFKSNKVQSVKVKSVGNGGYKFVDEAVE